jgi:hypothetical protein
MDACGHLTKPVQVCSCAEGWICEQHPDRAWPHEDCAGPAMPCPRCQAADERPRLPKDWRSIASSLRWSE